MPVYESGTDGNDTLYGNQLKKDADVLAAVLVQLASAPKPALARQFAPVRAHTPRTFPVRGSMRPDPA